MIYAKLTEELKSAPKTDNPEYTIFLRNLVMSYELNDLYEYFVPIIEDPDIDKDIRFSAYYSCSIYFRRNNKFEEMIKLADNYARYFINYALNDIVLSFKYRYTALSYSSSDMMYKAISYACSAKKKIEHHKAILHHYAETIATGLDHDFIGDEEREGFIQEAINAINESIELWNTEPAQIKYAKNYATLGRLYIHKCEYDMGSYYITKALNYENGDNKDSLNRIIKYNNYLYNSQFQKSILVLHKQANEMSERLNIVTQNYENKINEVTKELNDSKLRFLEFLAFFSSIIAFIMCTITLFVNSANFYIAVYFVIVLGGIIILSFSIFSMTLEVTTKINKNHTIFTIIIILSLSLILAGIFLGYHFVQHT